MNTDDGMAELLYAASEGAPPNRVDLAAVVRDGHRRRRRRRIVLPLAAAAAVLAVVAGVLAAGALRPQGLAPVSPATQPPSVTPATGLPADRRAFGLSETLGHELSSVWLSASAHELVYGPAGDPAITAWFFAPDGGGGLRQVLEQPFIRVPAPAVRGRPASYLYGAGAGEDGDALAGIAFEWAPGAPALILHGLAPELDEAQLSRIAASLRTDVDEPARFGFTAVAPETLRLDWSVAEVTDEETGAWHLWFGLDDAPVPAPVSDAPRVTVSVGVWSSLPEPNTVVGGRPAHVVDDATTYDIKLFDVGAYTVEVIVAGAGSRSLFTADQANALALSVLPLGSWTDRAQWTDDPIR